MATSFVNVNQGVMNPLQVAQSLNEAQKGIRESTDWGNAQLLKNLYSGSLNSDGSLRQSEFLGKAAKAGVGPSAVSAWLETQNKTNEAAQKQTMNNAVQKLYGLKPEELRDRNQLPAAQGAGSTSQQGQVGASAFIPKATTGVKAETAKDTGAQGKGESEDSGTQSEGLFSKIVNGVKSAFGANEPEATKASYSYLTPTEKYESDKPLTESASGMVGNASDNRVITGYDDNFQPIYANDSGYKIDNQGMLTSNSSGQIGSNVDIKANEGALQGQGFTAVAPSADNGYRPQPAPQQQAQAPRQDGRSILERLADSGTGIPNASNLGIGSGNGQATSPDTNLFQWDVASTDTNQYRQYKQAQDALLKSKGFADAGTYLKSVYDQTILANAAPGINPLVLLEDPSNPGKGMSELGKQIVASAQGNQKAEGLARQAVLAAKSELVKLAQDYGQQTVDQRKSELNGNMILRDPSTRQTAVTLLSNRGAIDETLLQLNNARTQLDVQMVAPMVAKAVGMSYGNQATEFNIAEVYKSAFPEMNTDLLASLALGTVAAIKNDNWSGVGRLLDNINPADPAAIRTNLYNLLKTAHETTEQQIKGYVVNPAEHKLGELGASGPIKKPDVGPGAFNPKAPLTPGAGTGTKQDPIAYKRGMKTYKGKFYNVGGIVVEGKN